MRAEGSISRYGNAPNHMLCVSGERINKRRARSLALNAFSLSTENISWNSGVTRESLT